MAATTKSPSKDPDELLARIKATFPDVTWSSFRYLDEGWDHEVIILDDRLVFRFPNDADYLKLLKREVEVLRRLRPLVAPVRIPDYGYVAPGCQFAGYHLIAGEALKRPYFDALAASDRTAIAKQLARFLSDLHTAMQRGHDFSDVAESDLVETQAEDRELAVKHLRPALSAEDYALVEAILDATDEVLAQKLPTVLLHGDVYSTHLLWDAAAGQLGIIDFSDMNRGDPAFDFAELYEYGREFVQEVYGYYTRPKDATFLQRALKYQKWVGVFMMVDHFVHHKTSFAQARETFDRTKRL